MAITAGTRVVTNTAAGTSHTVSSVAVPANAKLIIVIGIESDTVTTSNLLFNSTALTLITSSIPSGNVITEVYYVDLSVSAGSYSLTFDTSISIATGVAIFPLEGAATGAVEAYANDAAGSGSSATVGGTAITASNGAYLCAVAVNAASGGNIDSVSADVTLGSQNSSWGGRIGQAYGSAGSGGSKSATFTFSTTTGVKRSHIVSVAEASTGLSITSVTPSSFDDGKSVVIAGSGFGASQGSSTVTIGGVAQTVTAWSDTSITFTSVRSTQSMGNATLTVTKV